MAKVDWIKLRAEYVNNSLMTLAVLAQQHGLQEATVRQRCSREGWGRDRQRKNMALLNESTRQAVINGAVELVKVNERALRLAEKLDKRIEQQLDDDGPFDALTLRQLAGANSESLRTSRLALGASLTNETPPAPLDDELNLEVLTDEEFEILSALLTKCQRTPPLPGEVVQREEAA